MHVCTYVPSSTTGQACKQAGMHTHAYLGERPSVLGVFTIVLPVDHLRLDQCVVRGACYVISDT